MYDIHEVQLLMDEKKSLSSKIIIKLLKLVMHLTVLEGKIFITFYQSNNIITGVLTLKTK